MTHRNNEMATRRDMFTFAAHFFGQYEHSLDVER